MTITIEMTSRMEKCKEMMSLASPSSKTITQALKSRMRIDKHSTLVSVMMLRNKIRSKLPLIKGMYHSKRESMIRKLSRTQSRT